MSVNMFGTINEIQLIIRFMNTKHVWLYEICEVYGLNVLSDGMVRNWVRMFNAWSENVHDEEYSNCQRRFASKGWRENSF